MCYSTGKYTACRSVHACFRPELLQALAAKGLTGEEEEEEEEEEEVVILLFVSLSFSALYNTVMVFRRSQLLT